MNISSDRKMKNPVLSNRDWHHLYKLFFVYILLRRREIVKAFLQNKLNILIDVRGESNFMECQTEQ